MPNKTIHINQILQDSGIEFHCFEEETLMYKGCDTFAAEHSPVRLEDADGDIVFRYHADIKDLAKAQNPQAGNCLRFDYGSDRLQERTGGFYEKGFGTGRFYSIEYNNSDFQVYTWSTGSPHVLVYLEDKQIAQIEKGPGTAESSDHYILYLLSDYESVKALLCFFTLWYDKMEYEYHGEAFRKTKKAALSGYSLVGLGKDKYDPAFMAENFPDAEIKNSQVNWGVIKNEMTGYWKAVRDRTFTRDNFKKKILSPLVLLLCIILLLVFGVIFSFFSISLGLLVIAFGLFCEGIVFFLIWLCCRKR
jgi:hypothetical protein